jgi:signal transduction histidine kinase/DNA-binding response OmpR family regulator/ligand-binding sensor domain-containing protein
MHYDITDGLSGIEVNDIKENDNFLWIATSDGLNRFDGENFKIFKRVNGSENSLNGNNIETLFFDSEGYLWIGLKTGGVDIYDPRHDKFSHLSQLIREPLPARVISIAEDSERNIWLGTWEEGVYRLIPEGTGRISYKAEIHYPGFIVSAITEKPKGYIRIGTYSGLYVYSMAEKKWTDAGLYDKSITQFLDTGEENALWCSTWSSGLLVVAWDNINPAPMKISRLYTGEKFRSIHRIIEGSDNKLYIGTWGEGIKLMDIGHPDQVNSLASETRIAPLINCMFKDRSENIWIGSFGGGIYKFNSENNFISYFPLNNSLPAPAIALADFGSNRVLAGTQGKGIYLCNLEDNKLILKYNHTPKGGFSNYILSLYSDKMYIFAGHDGQGTPYYINKELPDTGFRFREYPGNEEFEKATAFYPGENGQIWIGTKQNGLFSVKINPTTNRPEQLVHYETFGRDEITGFAQLNKKQLFISSHNGLFLFDTDSDRIDEKGRIITNEIVYRIVRDDANHCLWLGTSANLLYLDLDKPDIAHKALPDDILPQGAIRVLTLDKNNNLWFSIRDRLFCLPGKEKRIFELNPALLDNKAILSSTMTHRNGVENLVLGTTGNLIILDPQKILSQSRMPSILFTGLEIDHRKIGVGEKVYGKTVLNEATEYVSTLKLSHRCRWISLSFAENEWDICKNKFQFRIKGFSDKWQYLDLSNPVTISQLNPGKYTFEIRRFDMKENTDICWSMDTLILPPWWKTVWFFILLSVSVLIIIGFSGSMIISYIRKRHLQKLTEIETQKQDELLREKESFFTGLSHDLMTPFSLILSPVNDLLRDSPDDDPRKEKLEIISKNTAFLSDIFSTILDFKRVELADNQLKEVNVEVVSFSRIVLNAFEYLAKSRKIALNFNSSLASLNILTDNIKIERILYNLLSNAIKFTPDGGTITLSLELTYPDHLTIKIDDNGCGMDIRNHSVFEKFYREPDKPGFNNSGGLGLGLYVVKKFVTLLNGEIIVKSSPGYGTEISIILPVRINDLFETAIADRQVTSMDENLSTILVVEDNDQMREYVSKKMGSNFNVITASNGAEALKVVEQYLPEIILTDVMMPEMDGLSLCRKIKENNRYSDLFVVLISARISTEDELDAYKNGADIYIKKPFDSEVLLNQMINIHGTRQKRKSQLLASLLSKEDLEIVFDPKETFIKRSMKVIEENIMDADFKIDRFASEMNLSNTVLHRKFKLFVGQTPNQFIRLVRLRRSVSLLRNSDHTIAEIANLTGFNQSHYFIKCFREVYNDTPKNFREQNKLS